MLTLYRAFSCDFFYKMDFKPKSSEVKHFFWTILLVGLIVLQLASNCESQRTFQEKSLCSDRNSEFLDSMGEEIHCQDLISRLSAEVLKLRTDLSNAVKRMENSRGSDDDSENSKRLIRILANMFSQNSSQISAENSEIRRKLEQQMALTASLLASNSTIQQRLGELEEKNRQTEDEIDALKEENRSLRTTLTELKKLRFTTNEDQEPTVNGSVHEQLENVRTALKEQEALVKAVLQKNAVLEEWIPTVARLNNTLMDLTSSHRELSSSLEFYNLTINEHFLGSDLRSKEQEQRIRATNNSCFREINDLRSETRQQRQNAVTPDNYEVSYVRWGRKTCPANATIIYTGYMAGSHYTEKGGGSNYLCVSDRPQWGSNNRVGTQYMGSLLYGAEYEMGDANNSPFLTTNNAGRAFLNLDPPCVACRTQGRSQQLMIPGRTDCPSGWRFQYRGYLATAHRSHRKMDFICLDEAPEVLASSYRDENGALLYPVEVVCGALPCPPFVAGNEIACVVCVM